MCQASEPTQFSQLQTHEDAKDIHSNTKQRASTLFWGPWYLKSEFPVCEAPTSPTSANSELRMYKD